METQDLFGYLQEKTGATYLSDIRYSPTREKAIRFALDVRDDAYPIRMWQDLIQYLAVAPSAESVSVPQIKRQMASVLTAMHE